MITAKQLYYGYKDSTYNSFLPLADIKECEAFIKGHREQCERESLTIVIEYFYEWMLDSWAEV